MQTVESLKHVLSRSGSRAKRFEATSMPVDVAASALLFSALCCEFRRKPIAEFSELPDADGMVGVRPGEIVRAVALVSDADTGCLFLDAVRLYAKRLSGLQSEDSHNDRPRSLTIRRPDGNKVMFAYVVPGLGRDDLRSTWIAGAVYDRGLPDLMPEAVLLNATSAVRSRLLSGALSSFVAIR